MFQAMNVPLIGVVENMSGLFCPHCGQVMRSLKKAEERARLPVRWAHPSWVVPLDAEIGSFGDRGVTFIGLETAAGTAFEKISAEF